LYIVHDGASLVSQVIADAVEGRRWFWAKSIAGRQTQRTLIGFTGSADIWKSIALWIILRHKATGSIGRKGGEWLKRRSLRLTGSS